MTRQQALKVIERALKIPLRNLAFGATLYEMGINDPQFSRDHNKRQQIYKALETLAKPEVIQPDLPGIEKDARTEGY